jgi:hypothetical protein
MIHPRVPTAIVGALILACVSSSARAKTRYYGSPPNYDDYCCIITRNGLSEFSDTHYLFTKETGSITLKDSADWVLEYRENAPGGDLVDVPSVDCGTIGSDVFRCTIWGSGLHPTYGGVDFTAVTTLGEADLYLHLELSQTGDGSVPEGRQILAPHMSFMASIAGDVLGTIHVRNLRNDQPYCEIGGNVTGLFQVDGDIDEGTELHVAGTGGCSGAILIGGDVHGPITIDNALTGQILVNGSLLSDIEVGSIDLDTGAVAIDWDGWHVGDHWAPGVYVFVNGTPYGINSPEQRVYRITKCKGDVDNDGDVDQDDADLLDSALSNPEGFAIDHPAFYGSIVFHGDLDCDGDLDEDDGDLFAARIAAGGCESTCAEGGACCLTDGACIFLISEACATYGGYFWGEGAICETNPCLDGQVVVWGRTDEEQSPFPSGIPNTGFVAVAGGYYHSLGLRHDGSIVAWGDNTYGQCDAPAVDPQNPFTAVAAGAFHSVGLKAGGSVVAWGAGDTGDPVDEWPHFGQSIDQQGEEGNPFVAIAAGDYHSLAVKSNGSILAWGAGESGETGDYHFGQSIAPYPNTGFVAVAAGSFHSLGRKSDHSVVAWGAGDAARTQNPPVSPHYGQSMVPENTSFQAVAANYFYSLGLTPDHTIQHWGQQQNPSQFPGPQQTGFTAIAAGVYHSLGLRNNGTIMTWGSNGDGQRDVPDLGSAFVYTTVASGAYHSLAIKQPTGACCNQGVCTQVTESDCNTDGGEWQGAAFECREVLHGDTNCDGAVNFDDINPFVTALVGQAGYDVRYPNCFWLSADVDCNGTVNFDDINPFVGQLVNPTCSVGTDAPGARASGGLESAAASESSAGIGVEVRIWVTTEPPNTSAGGNIVFRTGYGPLTPYATGSNDAGSYDIHRNYVSTSNPGSVGTPKFTPADIPDVVEPRDLAAETPVYVWAAFCGDGWGEDPETFEPIELDPIKPGLGWEYVDTAVQGLQIQLVTTGSLTLQPHWYQYENGASSTTVSARRWAEDSDMTGDLVTLVGLGTGAPPSIGWNAGYATERMQTWKLDYELGNPYGLGTYGAGGILLGVIEHVSGSGELFVGLGYKGIFSPSGTVTFFPGTEEDGIEANTVDEGLPPRVGQTAEATWSD